MTQALALDTHILLFVAAEHGLCSTMARSIQRAIDDFHAEVIIEQVDVWQRPELAIEHRVLTLPTAILMIDGGEATRFSGTKSQRRIRRELAGHLPAAKELSRLT